MPATAPTDIRLVSTVQAAEEVQVAPQRIRDWARRGLLTPIGHVKGRPFYDLSSVFQVEAAMARHAAERRPA